MKKDKKYFNIKTKTCKKTQCNEYFEQNLLKTFKLIDALDI